MGSPPPPGKRKASNAPISPPPLKRKVQSGTTKTAVANFFTPTSQKPKDRTVWSERGPNDDTPATLLVGRYEPEGVEDRTPRRKIAAFDLDSTLITTSSGKKHASGATDWKWWDLVVPGKLRELYEQGYRVVILSNQAGLTLHLDANYKGPRAGALKRVGEFKQKCSSILSNLDLPTTIYAATARDNYRKPRKGMWKEVCDDYDIPEDEVDLDASFFVGDAGGRIASLAPKGSDGVGALKKDFSCSDRNFAHNVGIDYKTPEEFFLGEAPRDFTRDFDLVNFPFEETAAGRSENMFEKTNEKDIVLFCGPPGAGKSTFYWNYLKPLGYERINQDTLKSRDKCVKFAQSHLEEGDSIVIDNTNADPDTRAVWIELAREAKCPIRCVWFKTPLRVCEHNDAVRSLNANLNPESRQALPGQAFNGFASRFKEPRVTEGFQDIIDVPFTFRGTREDYDIWGRYWV
ncbi:Bifunctional polynucleotide phosphatase/kinase-like protein [Hapsidospora chrysogenum ATCC 11550]|uniref:Bifunctional polynucleotide phosphatase/kinase-like protein n=1 Tax=Hapsidospora chrysogenum (strain ATCC 11550 / CBS 779.69 / DSM 880 / IAM 14645 / JCM 23072 / IMI 49137) TaxID=857340 RepID=A0A086T097_HAPC1|nr:Bifunctional polynucleotide phosphatase/kinase-like protein [Hapsidospora chrysogenum ATCC 11550]